MKARIVERTNPDGTRTYVIQQKHWVFRWWWVDAWLNRGDAGARDYFDTLEEAQANLCWFDGTEYVDKVVEQMRKTK